MWSINFATMATGNLNLGLFILPMAQSLNMSRQQFGWAATMRRVTAGCFSFFVGRILDLYGPRALIVLSSLTIGIALFLCSIITAPWHFIALFGILGISGLGAPNSIVTSVPVAKWFERNRGKALAEATSGLGIGGIFFLPFTQVLIETTGWRNTWATLSIIFVVLSVPLAILFLRRQPEDMGFHHRSEFHLDSILCIQNPNFLEINYRFYSAGSRPRRHYCASDTLLGRARIRSPNCFIFVRS